MALIAVTYPPLLFIIGDRILSFSEAILDCINFIRMDILLANIRMFLGSKRL